MKNIGVFCRFFFQFLEVKFSIYLNRRVFVMLAWYLSMIPFNILDTHACMHVYLHILTHIMNHTEDEKLNSIWAIS